MSSSIRYATGAAQADMPDAVVVDTDVISYVFRGDSRANLFRPHLEQSVPVLSFMTVAELDQWTIVHRWELGRRKRLDELISRCAIHLVDRDLCRVWAEVGATARSYGRPIQAADAWIAATALRLGVPLVTNNRADYAGVPGLRILPE